MGYYLGIDVGTSSVKVAALSENGVAVTVRSMYSDGEEKSPQGWWNAIVSGIRTLGESLDLSQTKGIGLTTQVGTYVLYRDDVPDNELSVTGWNVAGGEEELDFLIKSRPQSFYLQHVSMPYPKIVSYPAPRLMWLKKEHRDVYEQAQKLLAPKDYLYLRLTGVIASDYFSWNGFVDNARGEVTDEMLELTGIDRGKLPTMHPSTKSVGKITEVAASELGLPSGIPVTLGCNDCHASLIGMGVTKLTQRFDLTGTSEHIGIITSKKDGDDAFAWSPYFTGTCAFGVTASSGPSIDWGFKEFGQYDTDLEAIYKEVLTGKRRPPVFLPYLSGERSPIWDMSARGAFVGISSDTTKRDLLYSVLEGVVLSLWHIWERLPLEDRRSREPFRLGGGGAKNRLLGQMKADLFDAEFEIPKEKQSGALGAAMISATGERLFSSLSEAADVCVQTSFTVKPQNRATSLQERFNIYSRLYPSLSENFRYFSK